jgi:hypothetical protein
MQSDIPDVSLPLQTLIEQTKPERYFEVLRKAIRANNESTVLGLLENFEKICGNDSKVIEEVIDAYTDKYKHINQEGRDHVLNEAMISGIYKVSVIEKICALFLKYEHKISRFIGFDGKIPLFWAMYKIKEKPEYVLSLLDPSITGDYSSVANFQNDEGDTPLRMFCYYLTGNSLNILSRMLERGGDLFATNVEGSCAFDVLKQKNNLFELKDAADKDIFSCVERAKIEASVKLRILKALNDELGLRKELEKTAALKRSFSETGASTDTPPYKKQKRENNRSSVHNIVDAGSGLPSSSSSAFTSPTTSNSLPTPSSSTFHMFGFQPSPINPNVRGDPLNPANVGQQQYFNGAMFTHQQQHNHQHQQEHFQQLQQIQQNFPHLQQPLPQQQHQPQNQDPNSFSNSSYQFGGGFKFGSGQ